MRSERELQLLHTVTLKKVLGVLRSVQFSSGDGSNAALLFMNGDIALNGSQVASDVHFFRRTTPKSCVSDP